MCDFCCNFAPDLKNYELDDFGGSIAGADFVCLYLA